ncbi:lipoate--protein ligase family protein [Calorimonas adulescens]|jgi:Biotin/lipoate A/B protein ligase family.|nr:biotin/lipoate A/B protein ligase family protein [Calorimonas adulescens]
MMERVWRLIDTGYSDGAYNMAVDEALMESVAAGESPPVLRFFGWSPPTLSIGYFQRAEREVNLERLKGQGIGFVRRPTGGRAVLHDREITYSVSIRESDLPGSVIETYKVLSLGLVEGLKQLGIEAEVASLKESGTERALTSACFDSPSWYEVVFHGKKLIGSAQVRKYGTILQHGSIMLDFDPQKLALTMNVDDKARERIASMLSKKAGSLSEMAGREIGYSEAGQAISAGFKKVFGIGYIISSLTEEEEKRALELVEKYKSDEWNLMR